MRGLSRQLTDTSWGLPNLSVMTTLVETNLTETLAVDLDGQRSAPPQAPEAPNDLLGNHPPRSRRSSA